LPLPLVAIIGRPNVGKSTFFNRIVRHKSAITDDVPGVTRDRHYGKVEWLEHVFMLIDTGGFLPRSDQIIDQQVRRQAELAIDEADLLLLMADAQVGPADIDLEIARQLQRSGKPTLLVVNKADNPALELESSAFFSLGLGEPIPISAIGSRNIAELLDRIIALVPADLEEEAEEEALRIAVVGRPNVGKSSLVNRLIGDERLIVSELPGTTRDSIETEVEYQGRQLVLIDTAGLRRKARVKDNLEFYTALRTMRALQRADIALVLVEAPEGVISPDIKIINDAVLERKGVIVAVNKWDLVPKETNTAAQFTSSFHQKAPSLDYIPLVFISALSGQRMTRILDLALTVDEERRKRIPTAELNEWLERVTAQRHPPARQGKFIKFFYVSQVSTAPPTFLFVVNYPRLLDKAYLRYLENRLREQYQFTGVSLRMKFQQRSRRQIRK
jgi:GTP-binding protein